MGADLSKYESYSLVSYSSNPFPILNPSHVHHGPTPLSLRLQPDSSIFSTGDFTVHRSDTPNWVLYSTLTKWHSSKITLVDARQTAVCTIKSDSSWSSTKYTISRGAAGGSVAMTVKVRSKNGLELEVKTGSGDTLYVRTTESGKVIYIFSGYPMVQGQQQRGHLITKASIKSSGKMEAQIAVGVDQAAMVALLLLTEAVRRRERDANTAVES